MVQRIFYTLSDRVTIRIEKEGIVMGVNLKFSAGLSGKKWRIAICVCLLAVLLLLPIRMGEKGNTHIPVLRSVEAFSQAYCVEQLPKVGGALATTYLIRGIGEFWEEFSVTLPLLRAEIALGETITGLTDSLGSLAKMLLFCSGMLFLGATIIGMITFICFKLLIPFALGLRILYECCPEKLAWANEISRLLWTGALCFWLFFPATSGITQYIQRAYLDERIATEMTAIEEDQKKLDDLQGEVLPADETSADPAEGAVGEENAVSEVNPAMQEQETGFWAGIRGAGSTLADGVTSAASSIGDTIRGIGATLSPSAIKGYITSSIETIKNAIASLVRVVVMFLLISTIIPAAIFVLFLRIFKSLNPVTVKTSDAPKRSQDMASEGTKLQEM